MARVIQTPSLFAEKSIVHNSITPAYLGHLHALRAATYCMLVLLAPDGTPVQPAGRPRGGPAEVQQKVPAPIGGRGQSRRVLVTPWVGDDDQACDVRRRGAIRSIPHTRPTW